MPIFMIQHKKINGKIIYLKNQARTLIGLDFSNILFDWSLPHCT
jgi:hypothetical protein